MSTQQPLIQPRFNRETLNSALHSFFQKEEPTVSCPTSTQKYKIDEAFHGLPYWANKFRGDRFTYTLDNGILFRHEIVDEVYNMITSALNSSVDEGVMIKGAQGVGKSHSLVNTVLKLQSTGKYLVTFVPDCSKWDDEMDLIKVICHSFGSSSESLGIDRYAWNPGWVRPFIDDIDNILRTKKKQWVFVFDQINRLFARVENKGARDVGSLAKPFSVISTAMETGRITSVISASANNDISYKESHVGFREYNHVTGMTPKELSQVFTFPEKDTTRIMELTGGVPLYVRNLIEMKEDKYRTELTDSVRNSMHRLEQDNTGRVWTMIKDSVFASLSEQPTASDRYDKKFFIQERAESLFRYKAIVPEVRVCCRVILWEDIMGYVRAKEGHFLAVCKNVLTTNDTRGRLFELMVVERCWHQGAMVHLRNETFSIPASSEHTVLRMPGQFLPKLEVSSQDGVYVPNNPNFPAIDMLWKIDDRLFGVQVHVSDHLDVSPTFLKMCKDAGLFDKNFSVHLIYLSPEPGVTDLLPKSASLNRGTKRKRTLPGGCITTLAIDISSVDCLKTLQWPVGCTTTWRR